MNVHWFSTAAQSVDYWERRILLPPDHLHRRIVNQWYSLRYTGSSAIWRPIYPGKNQSTIDLFIFKIYQRRQDEVVVGTDQTDDFRLEERCLSESIDGEAHVFEEIIEILGFDIDEKFGNSRVFQLF
jgi:hypothetical protein